MWYSLQFPAVIPQTEGYVSTRYSPFRRESASASTGFSLDLHA